VGRGVEHNDGAVDLEELVPGGVLLPELDDSLEAGPATGRAGDHAGCRIEQGKGSLLDVDEVRVVSPALAPDTSSSDVDDVRQLDRRLAGLAA
jgi:hypothetical protein